MNTANNEFFDFTKSHEFGMDKSNRRSEFIKIRYFDNCDIKTLWDMVQFRNELLDAISNFHVDSAQAYFKWKVSVENWILSNKFNRGIHWKSPMECSIRAVNISIAASLFKNEIMNDIEFRKKLTKTLLLHGELISMDTEIKESGLTTNHTTTNFAALLLLSLVFPEYHKATEWGELGIKGLEMCMGQQVYSDGVNFEGSSRYHCYVLDIVAHTIIISQNSNIKFSDRFMATVSDMFDFLFSFMDNINYVHQIGDNDSRMFLSPSYVTDFGFFRVLYELVDFGENRNLQFRQNFVRTFKSGGYSIAKSKLFHCILAAVPIGQNGLGGHNHEDLLQLCLSCGGQPLFVDAGTGNYSYCYKLRNSLRKRESHGVPYIKERSSYLRFPSRAPFDIRSHDSFETMIEASGNDRTSFLRATVRFDSHTISRSVRLCDNKILLEDEFCSKDTENIAISQLLLDPSWLIDSLDQQRVSICSALGSNPIRIQLESDSNIRINKVQLSPEYNILGYSHMIVLSRNFKLRTKITASLRVL